MEISYKKILCFNIFIIIILLLNSFTINFLSGYTMLIFLMLLLIIFNKIFIIEKSRKRYAKDVILDITISLLIFFLLYYLFGLVSGFTKPENYYSINGITRYIIPLVITIYLKEFLRFQLLNKYENNKKLIILITFTFILFDITNQLYYCNLNSTKGLFDLFSLNILPSISSNILLTYVSLKVGYKPGIYYLLITKLYLYLLPIIPNPNSYLLSIINLLLPIFIFIKIKLFFKKENDENIISREFNKNKAVPLTISTIIIVTLVYFNSGYFTYRSLVIASNSMKPFISRGDIVLTKRQDEINVKDIIAYKYSDVIIVHRVIKRETLNNKYVYYTKGDNNKEDDDWMVKEDMILGKVVHEIPYVGSPAIWLRGE